MGPHVLAEGEPLRDRLVVPSLLRSGHQLQELLAFEVMLEDVLLVAGESTVREAEDVVAIGELLQDGTELREVACLTGSPDPRRCDFEPTDREEPTEPEDAPHRRRPLERRPFLRREGGYPRVNGILDRQRKTDVRELVDVDLPDVRLRKLVDVLEHPHIEKNTDHAL